MKMFDIQKEPELVLKHNLLAQTIIPRPIAWVLTKNNNILNIAPFSFFMGLSNTPARVMISVAKKPDGEEKDTLRNLLATKRCTLCMVDQKDLLPMHQSAQPLKACQSEAEHFNIPTHTIDSNYPDAVKGAPISYCCDLYKEVDIEADNRLLILTVQKIFVEQSAITQTQERLEINFDAVARIGKSYAKLDSTITQP